MISVGFLLRIDGFTLLTNLCSPTDGVWDRTVDAIGPYAYGKRLIPFSNSYLMSDTLHWELWGPGLNADDKSQDPPSTSNSPCKLLE